MEQTLCKGHTTPSPLNAIDGYFSVVEMDTEGVIASIAIDVSAFDLCGLYSAMEIFGFIAGVWITEGRALEGCRGVTRYPQNLSLGETIRV